MKFTSIDRIFATVNRELRNENLNQIDIIEWTGAALEHINAYRAKEEAVAFLKVKNYQCEIPFNLHQIIQIAKNTKITDPDVQTVVEAESTSTNDTDIPVPLDVNGLPETDYDIAYYRPYYDLKYDYLSWTMSGGYKRCYVPIRLSSNKFFNSIVCSENGSDCGIYDITKYEYTIIDGEILRFNFEKGYVAIAYLRNVTDEKGYPKIPDDISFITAIISYIRMQVMKQKYYAGQDGYERKMLHAEQDWHWYAKQASNKSLIPNSIDELENIRNQRNYMIPRTNVYNNYFGNLNNKEVKNMINSNPNNFFITKS
jgi:hypothetical protein